MKHQNQNGKFYVLIVDDERDLREEFKGAILDYFPSIQVEIAKDGLEAINILKSFKPHLILLDINMPGMNGFEVCKKIKSDITLSNSNIVIMTGMIQEKLLEKVLEAGATECLTKPIGFEELFNTIRMYRKQCLLTLPDQLAVIT